MSGVGAVALPTTPAAEVLQGMLAHAHAQHLSGFELREVAPWRDGVLVPMTNVLGPVTVVPVLPEHAHASELQQARPRPLVFVVDNLR